MKAAIIGLPQSGKSTVFSAATGLPVDPHAVREVRRAVVHVPDPRLGYLAELCHPKKVTQATIELIDIPGCSLNDAKGQEEWQRYLPLIRQAELLIVVLGEFENRRDVKRDVQTVWDELLLLDLDAVTTRLERLEKALKKPTKTHEGEKREQALLERCRDALESGQPLSSRIKTIEDRRLISSFAFLTLKPWVGLRNVADDQAGQANPLQGGCVPWEVPHAEATVVLSASIEAEIALLDAEDRPAFLAELGIETPAAERLIQTCYTACGLISFLTMGADEVRAWTIPQGATAVEAAAKIHTDIAQGFIRAETVAFDDIKTHKDLKGAKAAGRVRKEGKNYVVSDGDILNILASPVR